MEDRRSPQTQIALFPLRVIDPVEPDLHGQHALRGGPETDDGRERNNGSRSNAVKLRYDRMEKSLQRFREKRGGHLGQFRLVETDEQFHENDQKSQKRDKCRDDVKRRLCRVYVDSVPGYSFRKAPERLSRLFQPVRLLVEILCLQALFLRIIIR